MRTSQGGLRSRAAWAAVGSVAASALLAGSIWLPAHATGNPGPSTPPATSSTVTAATSATATGIGDVPGAVPAGPEQAAALGPVPSNPTAAAKYREKIRTLITKATAQRQKLRRELRQANTAASAAAQAAVAAERRAGLARDQLTLWASYLYRVSGNAGLILAIFNDPYADPAEFLRGAADSDLFSAQFISDVETAHSTAVQAAQASATAAQLREKAKAKAAQAEVARQGLVALLGKAQAVIDAAAAAKAAQAAAAAAALGAAGPQTIIDGRACPTSAPANTLRDGSDSIGITRLCQEAVAQAATPQAALAIQAAFQMLGAPYACGGVGRQDPFRFDCSSLVSRAYYLGAGIDTAGDNWAPSTRDMVPWDGVPLAWWASYVDPKFVRPGDIVLYDTGGAAYRHVVMYIGNGYMLHTNACGDVAHVSAFWGFESGGHHSFLVARRVIAPGGYRIPDPHPIPTRGPVPIPTKPDPGAGDPKVPPAPKPSPTPTVPVPTTAPVSTSPSESTSVTPPATTEPAPSDTTTTPAPSDTTTTPVPSDTTTTPAPSDSTTTPAATDSATPTA